MSKRQPKVDPRVAAAGPIAPPEIADYSDALSKAQLAALRELSPQDESKMGALVHEFRW